MSRLHLFRRTVVLLVGILTCGWCQPLFGGTTWYVRPDGGTRYSENVKEGQCDGRADAPYSGKGTNQHCAFSQAVFLWSDGSYSDGHRFPSYGWIGSGGDTYLIRGAIRDRVSYRVGWNNPNNSRDEATGRFWGVAGDPYLSGAPVPPSGTELQPTRILGGNYGACAAPEAKTQLHGGYGVNWVLSVAGVSHVEVQCLDITDFSACGKSSPDHGCSRSAPLSDYATTGLISSNTSTHILIQDVSLHGLAGEGMRGPTGDDFTMKRISIKGNASAGWNADDGTTGTGTLLVQDFDISWNGCQEEYPLVHPLPYAECLDDNSGGYGDGFGTATIESRPAWKATFDQGVVSYNTQDGLDALHLVGPGSSMTITHVLAYGNMGQQIKVGGAAGTASDNKLVANCTALKQSIPGTPTGFSRHLSDFCRAADTGIVITVGKGSRTVFERNVVYSNNATGIEVECDTTAGACDSSARITYRDNIFIGFRNAAGEYANPIYVGAQPNPFTNPGSVFDHNVTFHGKHNWNCPATELHETNAICADPHLRDEQWHPFDYGDMSLTGSLPAPVSSIGRPLKKGPGHAAKRPSLVMPLVCCAGIAATAGIGIWSRRPVQER